MKKFIVAILFIFTFISTTRAELVGLWDFDGTTGLEMTKGSNPGLWTGLKDGTRYVMNESNVTRVYDSSLNSYVWQFTPNKRHSGGYIDLGTIPELGIDGSSTTQASDFTISLWIKLDPTKDYKTNTDVTGFQDAVIFGDRASSKSTSSGTHNFFKAMTNNISYNTTANGGKSVNVYPSTNLTTDEWQFLTLTKKNGVFTTYLNGVQKSTATLTSGVLSSIGMKLGGNGTNSEVWPGSIDSFAIRNDAITADEVKSVYQSFIYSNTARETQSHFATADVLEGFHNASSQTLTKNTTWTGSKINWQVKEFGFGRMDGGSTITTDIEASIVGAKTEYGATEGYLRVSGTYGDTSGSHWIGAGLVSEESYTATEENPILFSVDRLYMNQNGSNARSSLWLWNSSSNFIQFAQNTERVTSGGAWSFNDTSLTYSEGYTYGFSDDLNTHNMAIKYDGKKAWLYADGKMVGYSETTLDSFKLVINGQSWGNATATIDSGFGTVRLSTLSSSNPLPVSDAFSTAAVSSNWKSTSTTDVYSSALRVRYTDSTKNVVLPSGLLSITGTNSATWTQPYAMDGLKVAVVRDSMDYSSTGTEGGLKIASLDGQKYITVSQNADGQWSLGWEGITVTGLKKGETEVSFTGSTADLYVGDYFQTQILMSAEGTNSGTNFTLKLDSNEYKISTDWNADGVLASLYANGTDAYVGFDDFAISGTSLPEPAAWILALFAAVLFLKTPLARKGH